MTVSMADCSPIRPMAKASSCLRRATTKLYHTTSSAGTGRPRRTRIARARPTAYIYITYMAGTTTTAFAAILFAPYGCHKPSQIKRTSSPPQPGGLSFASPPPSPGIYYQYIFFPLSTANQRLIINSIYNKIRRPSRASGLVNEKLNKFG